MEIKKGINLHLIDTNKFKTNLIAIFLSTPLTRENVTKNAVLSAVLRRGCNKYKTQEEISKELQEMYGAEFDCGLDKIGKNHVLKFYIETVNDEYLPKSEENNMLRKSIEIITEIIFNPLIEEEKFKEEYVEQEKENVKQVIEAKKDNKARYALFRCVEEMYKDKPEGLYKFGYVEDLENIDAKNLYEYYKTLIEECKIDIFVSGKLENVDVKQILNENSNIENLKEREPEYIVNKIQTKERIEENKVEESMDVTQGKLVIGYDVLVDENMQDDINTRYIGMVYNAILGGTATSKLFQNVREKASLAYTTNSSYSYFNSNIYVTAGIEIDNFQKAIDIIKQQIEDMKNGQFTEEEIENVKKILMSNIASINDEQDTEIIYFLGQELSGNNVSLEEYSKKVNAVDKKQIEDFAKKININTIYFLKN